MTRTRATDEPLQMDDDQLPVNFHIRTGERSGQQLGDIDLSKGKRVNDWGPWVALSCMFSGLAFGGVIAASILIPEIIDARTAEKSAPAAEQASTARREARVAIDQVQTMRLELSKKGIHVQLDDHQ